MNKNRIHQIQSGKNMRMSFAGHQDVLEMPNLIDIQKKSFDWFIAEGLKEIFEDISPITTAPDYTKLSLSFGSYFLKEPKHSIKECKDRGSTYSKGLWVNVKVINGINGEMKEHPIYMGEIPWMTDTGSFIINGAERVIVSQIVRSPGIYFDSHTDKSGNDLYTGQIIPSRGAWIEFETDSNNIFWARLDRVGKVPVTVLIRALGYGTDQDILDLFGEEPKILEAMKKDDSNSTEKALARIYEKMRPGEPAESEAASSLFNNMLFDPKRYDLAHVGRYKFNKKMNLCYRLNGATLAEDVIDPMTGEVLFEKGKTFAGREDRKDALKIQNSGVQYVLCEDQKTHKTFKVLSNQMVEADEYLAGLGLTCEECHITESVFYPVLQEILFANEDKEAAKAELIARHKELQPPHIIREEILSSINYLMNLEHGIGTTDDIDHLANRRIRAVGELLQNQYRLGMSRMERVVKEKMQTQDPDTVTPQQLINIKPVTAAVKEFFGSSQLSQFMDQNNPLSELTHKRRLSALGPNGLSRERAGFEVRDVHYTHYGRMCPIETPEGSNIGLINSLASYAKVNNYGFIQAPYRIVDLSDPKNPVVTNEVKYFAADEEDDYIVAQANTPLDEEGHFINKMVQCRFRDETKEFDREKVELMDVSPKQVFSVATSMIPFLANDDANRALMGSNMQRQAVPLMITEAPVIDTGLAAKVAKDSGVCQVAKASGVVTFSSADEIRVVSDKDGEEIVYVLKKFERSNQSNSYNQKPIVVAGEHVEEGQIIADGPSTSNGEIALGRNPLIGFMTWEGYNYEDAVLLSERLVQDDVFTSIHIEEYEIEARDTKLGAEEITKDVPGVGDEALKDLGDDGIIRIGAEVRAGDILVGKVTPKGEADMTNEERLLRAIFNEKAREVRDTSLKLPHGAYGTIIDTKVFDRKTNDELPAGVQKSVRIYVAQKRKISVGDKMAGRHGNKGVVSRVLPVEDMPFLPNGRPLDIVLNPLGVPSRMNIGQILEIHLSLAAKALGVNISTPIFDGASEKEIGDLLEVANDYVNMDDFADFKAKYEDTLSDDLMTYLGEHLEHRALWKGVPISRDGKVQLRDGRTGEPFDSPTTIGHMHYLKLHHLVDDKIHARSTGPYSLVTQQPLGGKAQFGGQRFGEMEVWALEAYGASHTLQEILTVKSDDVIGRVKTYEAIIKGQSIPKAGTPESFRVLFRELQSLGLDVEVLDKEDNIVPLGEMPDVGNTSYSAAERNASREERFTKEELAEIMGEALDREADVEEANAAGYTMQHIDEDEGEIKDDVVETSQNDEE